jgi:hypothetical protein
MVQGSRGYQEDTKTEYLYDNSAWRLAVPYIEFTAGSQALGAGVYSGQTGWSVDSSRSTDTSMVTVSGGVFTVVRAGLYAFDFIAATFTPGDFVTVSTDLAHTNFVAIGHPISNVVQCSRAAYRVLSDNTPLYLWAFSSGSTNIAGRTISFVRIG